MKEIHSFIHLLTTLNPKKNKSQIKSQFSFLANSYFYNYKPSLRIRQHRVLKNLEKIKDIVITEPDKGNGVVILDRKLYNNAIQEIVSDTSKFEKLNEDPNLKRKASQIMFFTSVETKKAFLTLINVISCILLALLLLVSMVLLKCTNSPLMIHFLNFVLLSYL